MIAKRFSVLALAGCLAFPATTFAGGPEIPMPKEYHTLTITMGGGAGIVIAMLPMEISGKIAFCGAVWPANAKLEVLARKRAVLREVKVEIKGKDVPAQFSVFPEYNSAGEAKKARCAVSNKQWQGPYTGKDLNLTMRSSTLRE